MKLKTFALAATMLLAVSGTALANSCPSKIAAAKKMAVEMNITGDLLDKFNKKIAEAQADHDAGKHTESLAAVKEALTLVGM